MAAVGEPCIPTYAYDAIIPFGSSDVSLELVDSSYYPTEDVPYRLYPGQLGITPQEYQDQECPECEPTGATWTDPGPVYNNDAPYPSTLILDSSDGLVRGHFASQWIVGIVIYNPIQGTVAKLESLTVRVNYTPPGQPPAAERWEWEQIYNKWSEFVKTTVLNPDNVYDYREPVNFVDVIGYDEYEEEGEIVKVAYNKPSAYFSSSVPIDDDNSWPEDGTFPYPYIIITNNKAYYYNEYPVDINLTSASGFSDFRAWKKDKGVPTLVKTVDDIKTHYPQEGNEYWDWQVAVRKFLKAQLKNGYEYVLFVGDVDSLDYEPTYKKYWGKWGVVPIRVLVYEDDPVNPYRPDVIPSDIYYMDLDINWNPDGDDYFGEPGEISGPNVFKPDIACGWIPATTATEFSGWLWKLLKYEKDPNVEKIGGKTYLHRALHVAADVALDPKSLEKYLFDNYIPAYFYKKTMYEGKEGWPDWPLVLRPDRPEPYEVSEAVNEGYGLIEIDTHGHVYYFDLMTRTDNAGMVQSWASDQYQKNMRVHRTIYPSTVAELYSEKERYGVLYSESCNINDFTYDKHDQLSKPVCESFIFNYHGGGVAFLGTTRSGVWGWLRPWSARLRNIFYEKLMNKTPGWDDDNYIIGPTYAWTRYEYFRRAPTWEWKHPLTYMHMLTGDPEMNVWTDDPVQMYMFVDTERISDQYYRVKVNVNYLEGSERKNISLANVCLSGDGTYLLNISNGNGVCEFRVPTTTPGGKIVATKHNFIRAAANFTKP